MLRAIVNGQRRIIINLKFSLKKGYFKAIIGDGDIKNNNNKKNLDWLNK